jgi:hypothetical protein
MKKHLLSVQVRHQLGLLLFVMLTVLGTSCSDTCSTTYTYTVQEPQYMLRTELREAVKTIAPQALENPGKIYVRGNYLFINEVNKGIHIFNNSDPSSPRPVSFITIPGNVDLAVKGNILYADSYIDLLAFDISQPEATHLVKRLVDVFPNFGWVNTTSPTIITGYKAVEKTEVIDDCNGGGGRFMSTQSFNDGANRALGVSGPGGGGSVGVGGSMARFTIVNNHLYTVSMSSLQLFDITSPSDPQTGNKISLPWGIETIFPYENKLFIGAQNGMHIYDNSTPTAPQHLSTFAHVQSCDPVVVQGDYAYVTLRSGNACFGNTNQLDVINIKDPRQPRLIKTYPMQNPHGLGIDNELLFLCEGQHGLKLFNAADPLQIDKNLLQHFKNIDAYDVIPLGNTLLMIGKDGLFQYDYSQNNELRLLSVIPVNRN